MNTTTSVVNARDFVKQLITATIDIVEFPFSGRIVPEYKENKVREKLHKNYRIIYRIDNNEVEVVSILHQSRRLNKQHL